MESTEEITYENWYYKKEERATHNKAFSNNVVTFNNDPELKTLHIYTPKSYRDNFDEAKPLLNSITIHEYSDSVAIVLSINRRSPKYQPTTTMYNLIDAANTPINKFDLAYGHIKTSTFKFDNEVRSLISYFRLINDNYSILEIIGSLYTICKINPAFTQIKQYIEEEDYNTAIDLAIMGEQALGHTEQGHKAIVYLAEKIQDYVKKIDDGNIQLNSDHLKLIGLLDAYFCAHYDYKQEKETYNSSQEKLLPPEDKLLPILENQLKLALNREEKNQNKIDFIYARLCGNDGIEENEENISGDWETLCRLAKKTREMKETPTVKDKLQFTLRAGNQKPDSSDSTPPSSENDEETPSTYSINSSGYSTT